MLTMGPRGNSAIATLLLFPALVIARLGHHVRLGDLFSRIDQKKKKTWRKEYTVGYYLDI
jgi:hypothetical protein